MSCLKEFSLLLAVAFLSAGDAFVPPSSSSLRTRSPPPQHPQHPLQPPTSSQLLRLHYSASAKSWSEKRSSSLLSSSDDDDAGQESNDNEEARRLQEKAQQLRDQIRLMESQIGEQRQIRLDSQEYGDDDDANDDDASDENEGKSLKNKRVLILGANGRLGSMITRHLLRTHPEVKEVVAAVHYVGEATTRGYGRLSYEVGAEDGRGTIGAAWADDRDAYFEYDSEVMAGYNLNKLRVVEVELLDPVQVRTITEDVDAVIYCATDFEGNRPRAVASLDIGLLFRAVASPQKGRVEIEGLRNAFEGLAASMGQRRWKERLEPPKEVDPQLKSTDPTQFVLVSTTPDAFGGFETPFGEFNGIKRQGELIAMEEFPSVSHSVLQMGKFDDNFTEEGQELKYAVAEEDTVVVDGVVNNAERIDNGMRLRINRRDAARAAVEALLDEDLEGKKSQVFTSVRKNDIW